MPKPEGTVNVPDRTPFHAKVPEVPLVDLLCEKIPSAFFESDLLSTYPFVATVSAASVDTV